MRVSVRANDSGYQAYSLNRGYGLRPFVKFNGEPQFYAITADSEAGVLVRYALDDNGRVQYDAERQCIVDEVVHGKVEIEFAPMAVL